MIVMRGHVVVAARFERGGLCSGRIGESGAFSFFVSYFWLI